LKQLWEQRKIEDAEKIEILVESRVIISLARETFQSLPSEIIAPSAALSVAREGSMESRYAKKCCSTR
jgi:hypothetical protein